MSTLFEGLAPEREEKRCWRTPPAFLVAVGERYGRIDLDAAAENAIVAVAPRFLSPVDDALGDGAWAERFAPGATGVSAWLNPPYGRDTATIPGIGRWIDRAVAEVRGGRLSRLLLLVPEVPDTRWWWTAASVADEILSVGRISFLRPDGTPGPTGAPQGYSLFVLRDREPSPGVCSMRRWLWRGRR